MKLQYKCTDCGKKNNIIYAIIAFTPFFLKCHKCGALMRVTKIFPYLAFIFMSFGLVIIFYMQDNISNGVFSENFSVWLLFGLFFAYEIVVSLLMCNMSTLVVIRKGKTSEDSN